MEKETKLKDYFKSIIDGLEWVKDHEELHRTYYRVNKDKRIESLTLNGFGIKLEYVHLHLMEQEGTIVPRGTFDEVRNKAGKFVKGLITNLNSVAPTDTPDGDKKIWPQRGDGFCRLNSQGEIIHSAWIGSEKQQKIKAYGNCFRTEEEAEAARERAKQAFSQ